VLSQPKAANQSELQVLGAAEKKKEEEEPLSPPLAAVNESLRGAQQAV
jgi:hypothetical protein